MKKAKKIKNKHLYLTIHDWQILAECTFKTLHFL